MIFFWAGKRNFHLCGKTQFYGLSGKVRLSSFGGKTYICDFGRKIKFLVLLGNFDFLVLGKNTILRFWRKSDVFFFDGNTNFWIRWENLIFFLFRWKTHKFAVLAEEIDFFFVSVENAILKF